MNEISPNLQGLTAGLPPKERAEIEAAIASSPYLRQIMTEAVNAGSLRQIRLGTPGANEGGSYHSDKKAIYISPDTFTDPILKKDAQTRLDIITSTLGHETGHALYTQKAEKERYAASYAITEGVRSAGQDGEFDATAVVGAYIRSSRRDEALAEIHGWNALASRIEHTEGSPPSINDMLRRAAPSTDCIEPLKNGAGYRLASGILLDSDMQMSDHRIPKRGPINLEPVAQCHFDQSRASLGKSGAANYTNYYGGYLIEQLGDDTRGWVQPPAIKLDMAKLGLDKAQLESTGLRLPAEGFSIIDVSQGRYRPLVLRSTGSGMQGTPDSMEVALDEVRTHALGDDTPRQASPEHTITQATPEERDAREQAQREANRQGLSQEDTQQAIQAAAAGASTRRVAPAAGAARAIGQEQEDVPQAQRERAQDAPIVQGVPQAATVAAMARDAPDEGSAGLERERADTEPEARTATDDRHPSSPAVETSREPPQPPTVAAAPERELSPESERTAAKIEPTTTPERQNEPPPRISVDSEPQDARAVATPAPTTHDPDALRLGDRGDSVELLQYRLDRQGYRGQDGTQIPQTGQYGPDTEHAVRQFQTLHGLPATGVADQDTREAVDRALAAQRERERGEPGGLNRSAQESTPVRETPEPVAAARTVGLSASAGRGTDDKPEREPEPVARAEAQPATLAATAPDPVLAHRAATRDERDDERRPSADPDRAQTAAPEQAQQTPVLMTQPGHPAHAMYAQALSQIERGDVVPAGALTQEEKSRLAAGVVAQFLAEDKFATRIDGLYASKNNAAGPGMPASLIPVQGDPTTDYCHRASINVEQALQTSLAQSSTVAQAATLAREQELTKQQELAQQQDQDGPKGPTMRIGPRTLSPPQGPQGDGGGGDGGGGGGG